MYKITAYRSGIAFDESQAGTESTMRVKVNTFELMGYSVRVEEVKATATEAE